MKPNRVSFLAAAPLIFAAAVAEQWNAADFGIKPGTEDAAPKVTRVLEKVKQSGKAVELIFPKGTYHFYPESTQTHRLYISNHDQRLEHRVGLPLVGLKNFTLRADGCRFVFHGEMLPVLLQDSVGTTCQGFAISYATPFSAEGKIVAVDGDSTTLDFDPAVNPPWKIQNNRFFLDGETGSYAPRSAIVFREDGMIAPTGKEGDVVWKATVQQVEGTRVRFHWNAADKGFRCGDTVILRNTSRPHPAIVLYHAQQTTLADVVFHDSQGMALLAQRSRDIHITGGGCICSPGRKHTVSADACHFSNCSGKVVVENAMFEGMMDDAINVHATSLRIEHISKDRRALTLRYVHRQAYGFETFRAGENMRFIRSSTLENSEKTARVLAVENPDPKVLHITLDSPVPEGLGKGDAVENADWHPSVIFRNNTVRNNRARGALFTTPKPVLVEGNRFIRSSGSAILLAGDAVGWYESGACSDVVIRNNLFDHNLTAVYQFTNGIISICPQVAHPQEQKQRYHRHIRIEGNTFRTHRVPLLYAVSADDLIMQGNTVEYDDLYPALYGGTPYDIQHCGTVKLQETEKNDA